MEKQQIDKLKKEIQVLKRQKAYIPQLKKQVRKETIEEIAKRFEKINKGGKIIAYMLRVGEGIEVE